MAEWQPIETAPKDETRFLVATDLGYVMEAYWEPERDTFYGAGTHFTDYHDGEIRDPTHWMPLPEPPRG